ncbi:MAG: hypothetical protein O2923_01325 [Verrucomicrobia bacterium]|nr:hypothetical protein [Verrucomicrobiota bacterium]MDA1085434.1 hypothetical protein [Verrucomicrobiota bacterium]
MKRLEYWLFHGCNGLVAATGVVYGVMLYAMHPVDEFAVVNHPWQPLMLHAHIVCAPLLVAMLGHFAYHHAILPWRRGTREGRRSGFTMFILAVPMVVSGYFVQVTVSEIWQRAWVWVHVTVSGVWILFGLAHTAIHIAARMRAGAAARPLNPAD